MTPVIVGSRILRLAPFLVVELYDLLNRGQPNRGVVWATLLASLPVIWLIYLPLFASIG
jgi:hypothetical protein